ncbi:CBS domain-containing protein [Halobacteriovorax sp. HLS]|uniref:CBS domain-containing protein n=1 Tax=Halobacteriovorax sp. HLS TaxID=2234000 RepID=UPI0013E39ED8|nr:CBS domain-containing protein [Halobacteriovorax sp. HLS]
MLSNILIEEIYLKGQENISIKETDMFHEALEVLNKNHWGAVYITDNKKLIGLFTDGDARRVFTSNQAPIAMLNSQPISKYMTKAPISLSPKTSVQDAIELFNDKLILVAPIVDDSHNLLGVIHLQHLTKAILKLIK